MPSPPVVQQHKHSIVIWLKAPTPPHHATIATKGCFTLTINKPNILCSLGKATVTLQEPFLWEYGIVVTITAQELRIGIHSLVNGLVSTNSTALVGVSDITDHPLCIGGGVAEWPIYSRPSITAVYYQHRAITLDDNCTAVTTSESTCSDQSLITDPVHLSHTSLASSGEIRFSVQLLPSNSTQTILSIGNRVNLQYTDKEQLVIASADFQYPLVCSGSVPALVLLRVTLGYNASSNAIYMKLNNAFVCETTGPIWETLVQYVDSRPITFLRSMVKCFDNILYSREGVVSQVSMVIQRASCNQSCEYG